MVDDAGDSEQSRSTSQVLKGRVVLPKHLLLDGNILLAIRFLNHLASPVGYQSGKNQWQLATRYPVYIGDA